MSGKVLYVAGPMSGLPDFNYPAFFDAERKLREGGFQVLNPARTEGREDCKTWLDFMRAALIDLSKAEGVALLDGWHHSRGATLERDIANGLGLDVARVWAWLDGADQ